MTSRCSENPGSDSNHYGRARDASNPPTQARDFTDFRKNENNGMGPADCAVGATVCIAIGLAT